MAFGQLPLRAGGGEPGCRNLLPLTVSYVLPFRVRTNWTNSLRKMYDFGLTDLADAATRDRLKFVFSTPNRCGRPRPDNRQARRCRRLSRCLCRLRLLPEPLYPHGARRVARTLPGDQPVDPQPPPVPAAPDPRRPDRTCRTAAAPGCPFSADAPGPEEVSDAPTYAPAPPPISRRVARSCHACPPWRTMRMMACFDPLTTERSVIGAHWNPNHLLLFRHASAPLLHPDAPTSRPRAPFGGGPTPPTSFRPSS